MRAASSRFDSDPYSVCPASGTTARRIVTVYYRVLVSEWRRGWVRGTRPNFFSQVALMHDSDIPTLRKPRRVGHPIFIDKFQIAPRIGGQECPPHTSLRGQECPRHTVPAPHKIRNLLRRRRPAWFRPRMRAESPGGRLRRGAPSDRSGGSGDVQTRLLLAA